MESGGRIKHAAQQCIEGFIRCIDVPVLMENEWAENRLADMNLWISGTGACARGRASLDSRLASKPEACDVIVNLLHLLDAIIEECRMQSQVPESHSDLDEENPDHAEYEGQDRAFSPWSDDSNSDGQWEDANATRIPSASPLRETMYNIESMQDQLARIGLAIRRSGTRSRLQKADQRFKAAEHQELEGHLVGMLLIQLGYCPKERDSSKLNEVQLRLVRCNLKRRNRFLYSQQHSVGLVSHSVRRGDRTDVLGKAEAAQEKTIDEKPNSELSNDIPKHTNNTIVTGTSASQVSDNFALSQPVHATPATSSILSRTMIDLDYPNPPRFKDGAHIFRCPCCCEALPVEMATKNRWRKHIADDLSPYTCISANCDQPDVLFNTKGSWRQHILKDHSSMTYWICFACADGTQFKDKHAFIQHTMSNHAATILPAQIPVLCDLSKKEMPIGIQRCPLCNWPEEEGVEVENDALLSHIAKEIHSFSLRALPWADHNGQESDQRICESSEKAYKWVIQSDVLDNYGTKRPLREDGVWHSGYFEQNPYFANSSEASSSGEPNSNASRENELQKMRNEGRSIVHESGEPGEMETSVEIAEGNTRGEPLTTQPDPEDYTIAWICANSTEYFAAREFLDETHGIREHYPPNNRSEYTLGKIRMHGVTISLSITGEPAKVAEDVRQSFPNIRIWLMVGIGSGVPTRHDIRLGDVVVGIPANGHSGVMQYDFNKIIQGQDTQLEDFLDRPPGILFQAMGSLQVEYETEGHQLDQMVNQILERNQRLRVKYQRPDPTSDRLYKSQIIHPIDDESSCNSNCGDDPSRLIIRRPRTEIEDDPVIHYGLIASSDKMMKDATIRDKLVAENDILCFEMEAAGLMNNFPCLVIRGICDYADTHQNKAWQGYAAMMAAAYAKDLLSEIHSWEVEQEEKWVRSARIEFEGQKSGIPVDGNHGSVKMKFGPG